MRAVAVSWSLKGMEVLHRYEPDAVIDHMKDLLAMIKAERD